MTTEERFWRHVDQHGPGPVARPDLGPCWLWTGHLHTQGYGWLNHSPRRYRLAHRWAYQHLVGPIPAGLQLDHLCCVKRCVNVRHLEPVTARENVRRWWAGARGPQDPAIVRGLSASFSPRQFEALQTLAKGFGVSRTMIVRWAIDEYAARHPLGSQGNGKPREAVAV